MNPLPILLGVFAWNALKPQKPKTGGESWDQLGQLLARPELLDVLGSVSKLTDKTVSPEEKNAALMELITNPTVIELAKEVLHANESGEPHVTDVTESKVVPPNSASPQHSETPVFEPVEKIAGIEISEKLKKLYDNWYVSSSREP